MKFFSTVKIHDFLPCLLFLGWFFLVCSGQEEVSIAPMEAREKEALYSAIQGFVGEDWNGSDLYPDPCGWTPMQGVSCDLFNGYWYVTVMNIGPVLDNSLKCTHNAKFTHHLFELKHLRSLSFFNCFFSPTQNPTKIPSSDWETLSKSLVSLEFRSNPGLIGIIPLTIGSLKALQSLVLLENGLSGRLPQGIGNLVSLERLVLAGNRFSGQIPGSFGGLNRLLIFDSSRNSLSGSLPSTFGGLTSLLKLDLSSNRLEGMVPQEIGSLRNLTLMDLGGNNLSGGLPPSVAKMVSLTEMVISNNPIGGNLWNFGWERLQRLEVLDLSNVGLKGPIPESMAGMKKLRYLRLSNNKLSGNPPSGLQNLPDITALYLNSNNFQGKLEFSESFYRRMGKRFGAWDNPNLCYKVESILTGHVPYGLKPCDGQQETSISQGD